MAREVRSTASRRPTVISDWAWAFGTVWIAAIAGGLVQGGLWDANATGTQWLDILAPAAVIVAGGALAGYRLATRASASRFIAGLSAPIPIVGIAFVLMVGFSESAADLPVAAGIAAGIYLLAEVPLLGAFVVRVVRRGRAESFPLWTSWDARSALTAQFAAEIERATDGGRAVKVVRVYVEDDEGRARLRSDTGLLEAMGYRVVAIEPPRRPSRLGILAGLAFYLAALASGSRLILDPDQPRIVATFRLIGAAGHGPLPAESRSVRSLLVEVGRDVLVVIGWLVASVVVLVAVSFVEVRLSLGDTANSVLGLAMFVVLVMSVVLGPIWTIRRLGRRKGGP